jgi:Tol biopolymer transport system component
MSLGAFFRRPAVLLIAALCLLAGVITVLGRIAGGARGAPKAVALAGDSGAQATPALSPDGRRLAYSARGFSKDESFHIFVRQIPAGSPRQLTEGAANDISPVWSPNGASIAFLRLAGQHGECMVMPSDGGSIGSVADCSPGAGADPAQPMPALAWTRDGQSLVAIQAQGKQLPALAAIPLRGGSPRALSRPPDGVEGDTTPAVSPDGNAVAFVRVTSEGGDIWLCDPAGGNLRRLTFDDRPIRGIAWTTDGQELIYSAHRAGGWRLLRLPASGGSPREIQLSGTQAQFPALASGGRLVYVDTPSVSAIWQARLGTEIEGTEEKPLIHSTGREFGPAFSPDGERIADVSDESGSEEIWTAHRDGSHRVQITALAGPQLWPPRWSPDGRTLLFDGRAERDSEVYTAPSQLVSGPLKPNRVVLGSGASWSRDGHSILFQERGQIWRANPDGGNPRAILRDPGANWPVESFDGRYIFYRDRQAIWRVPSEGGMPELVVAAQRGILWPFIQPVKTGIYYSQFSPPEGAIAVTFFDLASRESAMSFLIRTMDQRQRAGFSISPDGRYIVYPRWDRSATRLMVVRNFK